MPDLTEDEIQQMLLTLLTLRPNEPAPEQTPLDARRAQAVVGAMDPIADWHEAWPGAAHPFSPSAASVFSVPDFPSGYGDQLDNEGYQARREVLRGVLRDVAPDEASQARSPADQDRLIDELLRDFANESFAQPDDPSAVMSRGGAR